MMMVYFVNPNILDKVNDIVYKIYPLYNLEVRVHYIM